MSIHFHPLRVKEVRKETSDAVSILFDVPEELKDIFHFSQGQSLTLRTTIDGEEVRRTYSLCSSPIDAEWRIAVKKVTGGKFSFFANTQLKKGDVLEVMPPVGKFNTTLSPAQKKRYLAFAAGSGITPVISLIKTTLATEPKSHFTLVYGNRNRQSIIFFEELEGLKNKYMDRFNLVHVLSREKTDIELTHGRINEKKISELEKLIDYGSADEIFICGPEEMIFTVKKFLEEKGIDKKKIHFELFTTPGETKTKTPAPGEPQRETQTGSKSNITIRLDGRSFDFDLDPNSATTILDAALKQGADLPYACKGGVCTTCKAKLLEGEIKMDMNWGLEEEEVKQGYILTCQSHPLTSKVVVDFDAK